MTNILRCPICDDEADLQVEQDATIIYSVVADDAQPDGVMLDEVEVQGSKTYRIVCMNCGEEGDGERFTADFLVEVDSRTCSVCAERVPMESIIDHLALHNPNGHDLSFEQALDAYESE